MKTRSSRGCRSWHSRWLQLSVSALAVAQDSAPDTESAMPRFAVIPPKPALPGHEHPAGTLQEWNGSFTYNGVKYNYVMVGADPVDQPDRD